MVASLDEFFNLMAQERKFHLETSEDPTLAEMGELYGKLMGDAENVASFRGRVDSIFSHLVSGRYDAEPGRLLHGLWLANAYARYLCFRLQDLPGSLRVTEAMLGLSSKLMSVQYEGYDLAAKCFPLILVLNVARLHGYAGNVEYCRDLLDDLENYVDDSGENASFSRYPDFVQNTMRTFSLRMAICLTSENRIYFKRKIQAERDRFQGSAQPTDLLHSFFLIVVCRKDSVFVCDADRAKGWTWNEVDLASGRLAIQLTKNRSSATVAFICASHSVAYIKSLLAAWRSGLLPVLIHEDYTEYEWNQARKTAGDKEAVLLLEEGLKPRFLSNEVSRLTIVSVAPFCEDRSDDADSSSDHRSLRFETATAPRSVDECALGLFTSGTSASPKLIVFKHRDLIAAARIEKSNDVLVSGKRILNLRPHFTSGGLNTLWPVLLSGGTIGLSDRTRRRPLARFLGEVLKTPYDLLVMSPASIRSLCDSLQDKPIGVHGLPLYFGGMTLPQVVVDDLVKAGLVPEMRYGMTEFAHILSKRPFGPAERDVQRAQGDVGLCYSGFEVRELNGRLAFRSDGMASFECRDGQMIGLRDQEGWYVTDDRGSLVQENEGIRIVLEGREHEVIAVNGFRFHSSQVESALSELQTSGLIHECRAIGFSDERTGQRLVLFWNAKEPLDEKTCKNREIQIHRHSLEKLSPFKRPTDLVYVDAWPYMANGKTDLAALRKRYRPA